MRRRSEPRLLRMTRKPCRPLSRRLWTGSARTPMLSRRTMMRSTRSWRRLSTPSSPRCTNLLEGLPELMEERCPSMMSCKMCHMSPETLFINFWAWTQLTSRKCILLSENSVLYIPPIQFCENKKEKLQRTFSSFWRLCKLWLHLTVTRIQIEVEADTTSELLHLVKCPAALPHHIMDDDLHFKSNLSVVDCIFCDVSVDGKRYVCRSKKTALDTWKISCTDTTNSFWEAELEYDDVVKHVSSIFPEADWTLLPLHF